MIDFGAQFLCHCVGDYWLQNDWMACNKKLKWFPAIVHGLLYTLPFLLITQSWKALLIIMVTHTIIDHTNIVLKLNQIKNWDFTHYRLFLLEQLGGGLVKKTSTHAADGYGLRPLFIRVWLIILQDNILHLLINYLTLKYLG